MAKFWQIFFRVIKSIKSSVNNDVLSVTSTGEVVAVAVETMGMEVVEEMMTTTGEVVVVAAVETAGMEVVDTTMMMTTGEARWKQR